MPYYKLCLQLFDIANNTTAKISSQLNMHGNAHIKSNTHDILNELESDSALIHTERLTRCYNKLKAVNEVSLNIPRGRIYGFLGMNGAGKSTFISMLMGILPPTSGTITMFGETVSAVKPCMRRKIGFVAQEQYFYPWMKVRALGRFVSSFYPNWCEAEFCRLLELLQIPTNRKIHQLSGGNKTKLALAIALAINPEILILDEPTTGLDPVARREFMESIVAQARNHNRTTFFSSHLVHEVEQCADIIGIIHNGKLCFEGMQEVLKEKTRELVVPSNTELKIPKTAQVWLDESSNSERRIVIHDTTLDFNDYFNKLKPINIRRLSLEDIFLACVKGKICEL